MTKPWNDKSRWGNGPWQKEPDHLDFKHAGFPCLLHRSPMGAWCGYVGVGAGHPLYGKDYDGIVGVSVHGGLTYSAPCSEGGAICHVPGPGESDDVWWLGFDCGHGWDVVPGMMVGEFRGFPGLFERDAKYRDMAYARAETERLANQLSRAWGATG